MSAFWQTVAVKRSAITTMAATHVVAAKDLSYTTRINAEVEQFLNNLVSFKTDSSMTIT
jgi:hypothetical protein